MTVYVLYYSDICYKYWLYYYAYYNISYISRIMTLLKAIVFAIQYIPGITPGLIYMHNKYIKGVGLCAYLC